MNRSAKSAKPKVARVLAVLALALTASATAGCGNASYPNNPRPPLTITISVFVGEDQIAFSPRKFGAGPVRFIITNQTGVKEKVTFSTDRDEQSVSIDPNQTAQKEMVLSPGYLSIDADKTAADGVQIDVGPKRPSAQQQLDQP